MHSLANCSRSRDWLASAQVHPGLSIDLLEAQCIWRTKAHHDSRAPKAAHLNTAIWVGYLRCQAAAYSNASVRDLASRCLPKAALRCEVSNAQKCPNYSASGGSEVQQQIRTIAPGLPHAPQRGFLRHAVAGPKGPTRRGSDNCGLDMCVPRKFATAHFL